MRRFIVILSVFFTLVGCSTQSENLGQELETAAITGKAWNERVELRLTINSTVAKVTANGVSISFQQRTDPNNTRVVIFDLPEPPFPFSAIPNGTKPPLPDLPQSPDEYNNRGTVTIEVRDSNGRRLVTPSPVYQPYGSVVSGEVNLLLPGGCPTGSTFQGRVVVNRYATEGVANPLCFLTLNTGKQGTSEAITALKNSISNELAIDRNVVFSIDGGANSVDPTGGQTEAHLDPIATNYQRINTAGIRASVNADTAHTNGITGAGVTVVVIGGGVNLPVGNPPGYDFVNNDAVPNDDFSYDLIGNGTTIVGHDTHVARIITTIAPDVNLLALKVCDKVGNCPSKYIAMAMMYLLNTGGGSPTIVNASIGGPLPDLTNFNLLQRPEFANLSSFLFIASAGNAGVAVNHYPGGYSPLSVPAGSLPNVLSVGGVGKNKLTLAWQTAEYTNPFNYDILASGTNLCPASVTFRCKNGVAYPDNLGVTGTSFAAPHVAGVAALFAEAQPGVNLRTLLLNNRQNGRVCYQKTATVCL
jgi:subtilisin family serine protease